MTAIFRSTLTYGREVSINNDKWDRNRDLENKGAKNIMVRTCHKKKWRKIHLSSVGMETGKENTLKHTGRSG